MRSQYIPPPGRPPITPADDTRLTAAEVSPCPRSRLPLGAPRHLPPMPSFSPRVVGREAELVYLLERWGKTLDGARQVVFLSGEAGIGKTTLTEAFVALLPRQPDVWIARGQCVEPYGAGEAYLPVLEAVGRLGREPGKGAVMAVFAQYAPTWLAQLPALVPAAERAGLERVLAGATRARMLRELVDALEVLSVQQLLVLVLEDLHWSDPSTVEFLAYLLRRQGRARLFLIGTYRPTEILAADHPLK
ncbi:MAG TPA: AAA family ATPase, partial [Candidatus Tectomicrobia bacterium]